MSCCCSDLWGGRCCPSPSQTGSGSGTVTSLPANVDLSPLSVFNYENFGAIQGNATFNSPAMSSMFAAAAAASPVGGGCYFKQGNYPINPIAGGYLVPPQTRLFGPATQAGVSIALNDGQQLLALQGDGTLFTCPVGPHTTGGQHFEHIAMAVGPAVAVLNSTTAIQALGGWGVRAYKCVFGNFPIAFKGQTLSAGLDQCVIVYNHGPNGDGPGGSRGGSAHVGIVRLGAAECYAIGPSEFLQQPIGSGGPTGVVCISIEDGADHCIVRDLHISDFDTCISYGLNNTHTVKHNRYTNLKLDCWSSAVWMESPVGGQIYDETYTACEFAGGQNSTATWPLVYVGNNAGASTTDTVNYAECSAYDSNADGYQLAGGTNFTLRGGFACGNGPTGFAGVAVTGPFGKIDLDGVNMTPFFLGALRLQSQQYAMRFAAGAAYADKCTVRGCDWTGYPPFTAPNTGPLFVGAGGIAAGGRLRINLTKGYNDAGATINGNVLPTVAVPATAASLGYFGPSRATATGVTSYALNGTTYPVPPGATLNLTLDAYDLFGALGAPLANVAWKGIWG